jgi:hypothetical protein
MIHLMPIEILHLAICNNPKETDYDHPKPP